MAAMAAGIVATTKTKRNLKPNSPSAGVLLSARSCPHRFVIYRQTMSASAAHAVRGMLRTVPALVRGVSNTCLALVRGVSGWIGCAAPTPLPPGHRRARSCGASRAQGKRLPRARQASTRPRVHHVVYRTHPAALCSDPPTLSTELVSTATSPLEKAMVRCKNAKVRSCTS